MVNLNTDKLKDLFLPKALVKFAAPGILLIALLFFYGDGPLIFGASWTTVQPAITFYLFAGIIALILTPVLLKEEPKYGLLIQLGVYVGVTVFINWLLSLTGVRAGYLSTTSVFATVVLQVVIANTEELLFRGALYRLGPIYSSLAFAGFHALVYGLNPILLILAFVTGIAFFVIYQFTKEYFGTAVNAGVHTGYNLALLGIRLLWFL